MSSPVGKPMIGSYGDAGNDELHGDAGNDSLRGDSPDFSRDPRPRGDDLIDGGTGADTAEFWAHPRAARGIEVDLPSGIATGDGRDRLIKIEGAVRRQRARGCHARGCARKCVLRGRWGRSVPGRRRRRSVHCGLGRRLLSGRRRERRDRLSQGLPSGSGQHPQRIGTRPRSRLPRGRRKRIRRVMRTTSSPEATGPIDFMDARPGQHPGRRR